MLALATLAAAQNEIPANNGGDVLYVYSSPSVGTSTGGPFSGDFYWRATGPNVLNDFDPAYIAISGSGASMEINGTVESIYDTDWSTSPSFYDRLHGPAIQNAMGGREPDFLTLGFTAGVTVVIGSSGFGNPCTVAPSLCSPPGGTCPPSGQVNGWRVGLDYGATTGTGIVVPADGTNASATATTWFLHDGMVLTGGACGLGDYVIQDLHSNDEQAADVTGNGINPDGGFQLSGFPFANELTTSMADSFETWHGNVIQGRGASFGSGGVGGALDGRYLPVGSGTAQLAITVVDRNGLGVTPAPIVVAGASLGGIPNPGAPVLGGNLLVAPTGLFFSTASVWIGPGTSPVFDSISLNVPVTAAGSTIHVQGATVDPVQITADTTNAARIELAL